jgi:hypothetical protein
MATARKEIETYLHRKEIAEGRRLKVAILFADSMLRELGMAVAEWEETAARLRRLKCETALPHYN